MPFLTAHFPNGTVVCAVVNPNRTAYGCLAMMLDVAALTMKNGLCAAVETAATAIALGVNTIPANNSTCR